MGLTLEEVGDTVGIGRSAVQKYEKGVIKNIYTSTVELFAKALVCSPAYLMCWTDDVHSNAETTSSQLNENESQEAKELVNAYSFASIKNKNIARAALDLPPLGTNNIEFSKEFDIREDMKKTLKELSSLPVMEPTKQK